MARYIGPVCRLCRREAMKLFLKGERCYTEKCAIEKRNFPPGQHGKTRKAKLAGYGLQLREKQKVKRIYGVLEAQFRTYFQEADRRKGITGENLLVMLERRLDNVIYSLGFAASRAQARQFVRHGHVHADGRKITIPSYQVKAGQAISIKEASRKNPLIRSSVETARGRGVPEWLELDAENTTGKVLRLPVREDIKLPIQEQLIVELYSR
jgi:small subunit ribosomal protein S4